MSEGSVREGVNADEAERPDERFREKVGEGGAEPKMSSRVSFWCAGGEGEREREVWGEEGTKVSSRNMVDMLSWW
jgi:hypothetical protein